MAPDKFCFVYWINCSRGVCTVAPWCFFNCHGCKKNGFIIFTDFTLESKGNIHCPFDDVTSKQSGMELGSGYKADVKEGLTWTVSVDTDNSTSKSVAFATGGSKGGRSFVPLSPRTNMLTSMRSLKSWSFIPNSSVVVKVLSRVLYKGGERAACPYKSNGYLLKNNTREVL